MQKCLNIFLLFYKKKKCSEKAPPRSCRIKINADFFFLLLPWDGSWGGDFALKGLFYYFKRVIFFLKKTNLQKTKKGNLQKKNLQKWKSTKKKEVELLTAARAGLNKPYQIGGRG